MTLRAYHAYIIIERLLVGVYINVIYSLQVFVYVFSKACGRVMTSLTFHQNLNKWNNVVI